MKRILIALLLIQLPAFCDPFCDPCAAYTEVGESLHIGGEWLYWKTRRSDLDYAIVGESTIDEGSDNIPDGKVHSICPDYDHGYRISALYNCDGCWTFGFNYTSFSTSDTSDVKRITQEDIFPSRKQSYVLNADDRDLQYAQATYDVDLNQYDIAFGFYSVLPSFNSQIRSFGGIRIAFLDQSMSTIYDEDYNENEELADKLKETLEMDAIGAVMGFEGRWGICEGAYLFGSFSGGLLVAEFDSKWELINYDNDSSGETLMRIKNEQCLPISVFHINAGIQYDLCRFLCANWDIKAGYELHQWCQMPDFIRTIDNNITLGRDKASLGFDGFFVKLNAKF